MLDMDRGALLVYLRDVRDMEVAIRILEQKKQDIEKNFRLQTKNLELVPIAKQLEEPKKPKVNGVIKAGAALTATGFFAEVGAPLLAFGVWGQRDEQKKYKKDLEYYNSECKRIEEQHLRVQSDKPKYDKLVEQRDLEIRQLNVELERAKERLAQVYSLNLLPNPYRNIQSVYYIYDYMSSSTASFEETLMHEHLENGFQRILESLNTILRQLQAVQFAQVGLYVQNQRMLSSLESIETNTYICSQYSAIAAANTSVNDYFVSSHYF